MERNRKYVWECRNEKEWKQEWERKEIGVYKVESECENAGTKKNNAKVTEGMKELPWAESIVSENTGREKNECRNDRGKKRSA